MITKKKWRSGFVCLWASLQKSGNAVVQVLLCCFNSKNNNMKIECCCLCHQQNQLLCSQRLYLTLQMQMHRRKVSRSYFKKTFQSVSTFLFLKLIINLHKGNEKTLLCDLMQFSSVNFSGGRQCISFYNQHLRFHIQINLRPQI